MDKQGWKTNVQESGVVVDNGAKIESIGWNYLNYCFYSYCIWLSTLTHPQFFRTSNPWPDIATIVTAEDLYSSDQNSCIRHAIGHAETEFSWPDWVWFRPLQTSTAYVIQISFFPPYIWLEWHPSIRDINLHHYVDQSIRIG
ncbi:hypothetical protein VNO77_27643 [Canavalia gladiata]|uniref:Uncharacterized protein n=1 Tax=Canavalia gladiata TaxID=3824 RepID=A0AAN9KVN4_CANGL